MLNKMKVNEADKRTTGQRRKEIIKAKFIEQKTTKNRDKKEKIGKKSKIKS